MKNQLVLEYKDAQIAIVVIQEKLIKSHKSAVVAVTDSYGELIVLIRMDNVPYSTVQIAINKAFTAARERIPSLEVGKKMHNPDHGYLVSYYGDSRYIGFPGGLPIIYKGQVLGAVAVSGLTGEEDISLAELGVSAILNAIGNDEM